MSHAHAYNLQYRPKHYITWK